MTEQELTAAIEERMKELEEVKRSIARCEKEYDRLTLRQIYLYHELAALQGARKESPASEANGDV